RISKAEILHKVYKIADEEPDVKDYVPEMVVAYTFSDSSTSVICERLNLLTKGVQILYLSVFKKLESIMTLHGNKFLTCWWHTVKLRFGCFRHSIHHHDVSASNLM
ncbi:hypothetical protein EV363DRAFT_1130084, partial [Boletus edulis]